METLSVARGGSLRVALGYTWRTPRLNFPIINDGRFSAAPVGPRAHIIKRFGCMTGYRIIDHTGDMGIKVRGKTLPELFQNAALAFFDILIKGSEPQTPLEEQISVSANDAEQLLVNWLGEFLYLYDTKRLIFHKFEIKEFEDDRIYAVARGEILDPKRHRVKTEIKAVTYHGLKIEKKRGVYSTIIIFDI